MKKLQGIYLVINPSMPREELLSKLGSALEGGIDLLQIWNHWPEGFSKKDKKNLIEEILQLADAYTVPVLINEDWQLLRETVLDGVHFDHIPEDWDEVKKSIGTKKIIGFTAGNDVELIRWADAQKVDYLSFCAMFPSSSVDSCEIVRPDAVLRAREVTGIPLFLSGGINPNNMAELARLDFQGVAIISGIMSAEDPGEKVKEYRKTLEDLKRIER